MANFSRNIKVVTDLPSYTGSIGLSDIGTKGSPPMYGSTTRKVSLVDWIQYAYDQGWLNFTDIPPGSVDFTEIQNISTNKLLGRYSAGTGVIQEITIGSGLTLSGGGTLSAAGGGGLTVGTSSISSGTSGRVLYDNAGVLGEMTTTGSGTELALSNSPTIVTPTIAKLANLTSNGFVKTSSGDGTLSIDTTTYVSAAAGSDTQVQFNDGGAFGGNSGLTFSKTLGLLNLNTSNITGITTSAGFKIAANSLTSGDAAYIGSSSLTSGRLLFLSMTGTTGLTGKVGMQVFSTGANATTGQTTTGISSIVANSGSGTNIGGVFFASGGSSNWGLQVSSGQLIIAGGTAGTPAVATTGFTTTGFTLDSTGITYSSVGTAYITLKPLSSTWTTTVSTGSGATAGLQFNANSLTTGNGIDASTSSLTTGMLAQFASTSTALSGTSSCVQKIMSTGANVNSGVTATGLNVSVANTNATSGTNVAATFSASGATTANYGILVPNGGVGIGISTGSAKLDIKTTAHAGSTYSLIIVDDNGNAALTLRDDYKLNLGNGSSIASQFVINSTNNNSGIYSPAYSPGSTELLKFSKFSTGYPQITMNFTTASSPLMNIGTATAFTALGITLAPTATANYGLVSIGDGAFDGLSAGKYTGSANGTHIAVNAGSGYTGDLITLQVGGSNRFKVTSAGDTYIYGSALFQAIQARNPLLGTVWNTGHGVNVVGLSIRPVATVSATSGTSEVLDINTTFAAGAGSANIRPLNVVYTINNSGAQSGTATGIFLAATETSLNSMVHNLMNLTVGGTSKFKVDNTGAVDAISYKVGGTTGATGTFTTTDLKTVTVTNGIIVSIV